ncbi:Dehydrogenase/reductase SDR family member 11 [Lamellibrachia satsuma]|nr:Dehydrogenase/reductase SDR family member 11 [Lamellibrachia satsuma]
MERWAGRVALVTGASSGIGAAIALALLNRGMKVIGCSRNVDKIEALANQMQEGSKGSLTVIRCDLRNQGDITSMFERIRSEFGALHICVNSAGLSKNAPLLSGDTNDWREMLDVNVLAMSVCTREAVTLMRDGGVDDGHIINMCSMSGHRTINNKMNSFYQATKFAVKALTEAVRCELRGLKSNIRVTEISPGLVETEFFARLGGEELSKKIFKNLNGLKAEDIADSVIYALSAPPHVQVHDILMRSTEQVI